MRFLVIVFALPLLGQDRSWVAESNRHAQILLSAQAKLAPESAGSLGLPGLDGEIRDLSPGLTGRARKVLTEAKISLEQRRREATHPLVRQDLDIMILAAAESLEGLELNEKYEIPYFNAVGAVFGGIRQLLDPQVAPERRAAALIRLRKYAGLEPGFQPLTVHAERETRAKLKQPGLLPPPRAQLERDLGNAQTLVEGLGQLLEKYKIEGYREPYDALKSQLTAYERFLRQDVLPISRTDFKLPPDLYTFSLKQYGVDIPATELTARARTAFADLQKQMQVIAPKVAAARGWKQTDYRAVIRELKKEQFNGEDIFAHYVGRIKDLEKIVRTHDLVTLPDREARMRLASAAESAQQPAPNMRPPRLIGNTGEAGEFVLPLKVPASNGNAQQYDDFTFAAASWTLTAHEARPGHEMQFATMVERGVSTARAVFAFNSVNVEGWGLYSEWLTMPYFPLEGQLISLQHRLLRSARAYIDPELHMGKMTPAEARRILLEDVVVSEAMVTQETERYMFRAPAQATSYFYGYLNLLALRQEVEKALGAKFRPRPFHDFILSQGLLPPKLLRQAVLAEFVPGTR
ncbi:MAG: DUF885 domain-containing protein [Acidobacteria bacterium]|nr:DUF885 domain-containing protein [Acidobacteriota bacterium]